MVTDEQVRRLFMLVTKEPTKALAAAKAGMSPKTARKYRITGRLPSQMIQPHIWRTREDPFIEMWPSVTDLLEVNPGLESKTIFEHLQRERPGLYQDGQLRTLQRRIRAWRATEGPPKEVFFAQIHHPGALCSSDFTNMNALGVTIQHQPFNHLAYHFTLTYSNWEHASICFSESMESLSAGLQAALWALGGVPGRHRTDRMTLAVNKDGHPERYTARYRALLGHYGLEAERTNPSSGHENGDVEQRHHRFKRAVLQALMLRGSRDFESRESYEAFLKGILRQLNAGRRERLEEEMPLLRPLPKVRLDDSKTMAVTVTSGSTISVLNNVYSVHSRLIGEQVQVRVGAEQLDVNYGGQLVVRLPRLRGQDGHHINYRHIIAWLERKPGAFANYRYQADLFPDSYFRMAYDAFKHRQPLQADKEYIRVLKIAAMEGEEATRSALRWLLSRQEPLTADLVESYVLARSAPPRLDDVTVANIPLSDYDALLGAVTDGAHE